MAARYSPTLAMRPIGIRRVSFSTKAGSCLLKTPPGEMVGAEQLLSAGVTLGLYQPALVAILNAQPSSAPPGDTGPRPAGRRLRGRKAQVHKAVLNAHAAMSAFDDATSVKSALSSGWARSPGDTSCRGNGHAMASRGSS
jgi:hypothetical protein